ncbi:mitotic fidelity of chromosome transmission- protein [Mycoemilia scoparia]|uniref:Mitotic fidelity of chromosome transmission-protein n=1 Tax=Mycoemilia scoparia TaxID=417184 RepID=A0A9W8A3W8_9FUNG|nr:mitotic fidelity of chromosome transmission- protein [Mycoemilia scoparia]
MGPAHDTRRATRPNKYDDIGIRGRKTGITLTGQVGYGEDGLEDEEEFYNLTSPKKVNKVTKSDSSSSDLFAGFTEMLPEENNENKRITRNTPKNYKSLETPSKQRPPSVGYAKRGRGSSRRTPGTATRYRRQPSLDITEITPSGSGKEADQEQPGLPQEPSTPPEKQDIEPEVHEEGEIKESAPWLKKPSNPRTIRRQTMMPIKEKPKERQNRRHTNVPGKLIREIPERAARGTRTPTGMTSPVASTPSSMGTARRTRGKKPPTFHPTSSFGEPSPFDHTPTPMDNRIIDNEEVLTPTQPLTNTTEDLTIPTVPLDLGEPDLSEQVFDDDGPVLDYDVGGSNSLEEDNGGHDEDVQENGDGNDSGAVTKVYKGTSNNGANTKNIQSKQQENPKKKARGGRKKKADADMDVKPELPTRASNRKRIRPLEFWRNEHIVYKLEKTDDKNYVPAFSKIATPSKEEKKDIVKKPRTTKAKQRKTYRKANEDDVFSDSDSEYETVEHKGKLRRVRRSMIDLNKQPAIEGIVSNEYGELVQQPLAYAHQNIPMLAPKKLSDSIRLGHTFKQTQEGFQFLNSGIIEIFPNKSKTPRKTGEKCMIFYVLKGHVRYHINDQSIELHRDAHFMVPRNNLYSIENIGKKSARLLFVQSAFPFPPPSEDEEGEEGAEEEGAE